jgi:hypothetical protein
MMNIQDLRDCLHTAASIIESTRTLDLSHNNLNSNVIIQEILKWLAIYRPMTVVFNDCQFEDAAAVAFAKFFRDDSSIQRISFRDNYIRSSGAREWVETLKTNTSIQSVDFLGNDLGEAGKDLVDWYLSSSTCRSLCGLTPHIQGFSVEDLTKTDALLIAGNLEKNTDLKSIEIFGNEPLIAVDTILNALALNRTLTRLKITKFPASLMAISALSRGLSKNSSLKSLELSLDSDMPELREGRVLSALFDAVECGRSLTAIRFEHLPSGSVVDNLCARLIQNHRSLMHFSVFQYKPDQTAVDLLCRGISQNMNLRVLRLGGELAGQLTAEAFREIGDAAMSRSSGMPLTVRIEGEEDRYFASPDQPIESMHDRSPEWEIDDFVELKALRNTWVSAQVIALLGDREYSLIRPTGEVQSNVSVEDIRKGSEFKHAQESTQTIVTPGGRDKHSSKKAQASDSHRRNGISSPTNSKVAKSNETIFSEGELVEVRFYGDSSWYAARVHNSSNPGLVDVVMTDDNTSETQVEAHMIRRPASFSNVAANTYDVGMYVRGDYVFARVPKNEGAWVRARVVSDKKNGTYDVRLEDQTDERGLRGRHLKHYFKVNDEVDARRSKSVLWERGTVVKTDKDGKYVLTFQTDDETESDVAGRRIMLKGREEVRTQAVLSYNKDKYGNRERTTSSSNRLSRKGSSKFALNEKVETQLSNAKWVEGRIVGQNPNGTYSVRLLDGSTMENVNEVGLRKAKGSSEFNNGNSAGSNPTGSEAGADEASTAGPVPSRPLGPAPSSSFKEKSRKIRSESTESIEGEKDGRERSKDRKERRRRPSGGGADGSKKKPGRSLSTNNDSSEEFDSNNGGSLKDKEKLIQDVNTANAMAAGSGQESESTLYKNGGSLAATVPSNGAEFSSLFAPASSDSVYKNGERVLANYRGLGKYFAAVISNVYSGESYDVLYDEGLQEQSVHMSLLRKIPSPISNNIKPFYAQDDSDRESTVESPILYNQRNSVLVFDQRSGSWRPGHIVGKYVNGYFRVRLQQSNEELDVPADYVNFNSVSPPVATEPIALTHTHALDDPSSRRPASANLLQAGRERDREKEMRNHLHPYGSHNVAGVNRPHTASGSYAASSGPQSFVADDARYSQTSDSSVQQRKRYMDVDCDKHYSPRTHDGLSTLQFPGPTDAFISHPGDTAVNGLGPAIVPGFVSLDGESLFHASSKFSVNVSVTNSLPSQVQNRPLPASGTGFGAFYNGQIREDTWSPILAYIFDIQTQCAIDAASNANHVVPLQTPTTLRAPSSPNQPSAALSTPRGTKSPSMAHLDPVGLGAFLPVDTVVTVVPTCTSEYVEFGRPQQDTSCRILWDGEKCSCPIFMRLKPVSSMEAISVEVRLYFYAYGTVIACASIDVSGHHVKKRPSKTGAPIFEYLTPEMRVMSDVRVGMFRSVYIITPKVAFSDGNQFRFLDAVLENAVKELPCITIRRPEPNEAINASYIRSSDHVVCCCVDGDEATASVNSSLQAVFSLFPTSVERESRVMFQIYDENMSNAKEKFGASYPLASANISCCPEGIYAKWVCSERGLRRHLRHKLLLSANAVCKFIFENCREERHTPIAMLAFPTESNFAIQFDVVTLYSALQDYKSSGNEAELPNRTWKLQLLCEDFVLPIDDAAHSPIEMLLTPALFLELYPLLKLTVAMLLLAKTGQAQDLIMPMAVNVTDLAGKYSIHALISLSIFYDEMEICCRDFTADQFAGVVSLGANSGNKLITSSAQDTRLSNDEVIYDDMELLAITSQLSESAIATVSLYGGLTKISRSLRLALDERVPGWLTQSAMRLFVLDDCARWISLGTYKRAWRNLLLLLNPALASNDGIVDETEQASEDDAGLTNPVIIRDPVEEISSNIKLGLRIRDDSIATTTAKCLTKEGCECWDDVLNLVEFVGAMSDAGNGVINHQSYQAVNKFLLSAGVPVIAAGKLVAFLRQHHNSKQLNTTV